MRTSHIKLCVARVINDVFEVPEGRKSKSVEKRIYVEAIINQWVFNKT